MSKGAWLHVKKLAIPSFKGEVHIFLPKTLTSDQHIKFNQLINLLKLKYQATEEAR